VKAVVIGAGILGASTAYHLAKKGIRVEIIDANHEGKATLAGAGIVCPWASAVEDGDFYNLYAMGARYYTQLIEGLRAGGESDFGYSKVGGLVVADKVQDFDEAARRIARRIADAPEAGRIEHLSAIAARTKFPPLREGQEAIFIPGAARVDARLLCAALLRRAQAMGAILIEDRASLGLRNGRVVCRTGEGIEREADEIIVTAGSWAAQILQNLGLNHPVAPQKGQIVHLRLPGTKTADWPVLLPTGPHYLLAFDDSRVVIGATREDHSGFDTKVTAGGIAQILNAGLAIAPGLADASYIETRVGLRPASTNLKPILGRVAGMAGMTIGNGLGAAGLTMGPFAGKLLADIVMGQVPDIDLSHYAPDPISLCP